MPLFGPILNQLEDDLIINMMVKSEALRQAGKMGNAQLEQGYPGITKTDYQNEFAKFLIPKKSKGKFAEDSLAMAILKAKVASLEEAVDYGILQLNDNCPGFAEVNSIIERACKNYAWCGEWQKLQEQNTVKGEPEEIAKIYAERRKMIDSFSGKTQTNTQTTGKKPPQVR